MLVDVAVGCVCCPKAKTTKICGPFGTSEEASAVRNSTEAQAVTQSTSMSEMAQDHRQSTEEPEGGLRRTATSNELRRGPSPRVDVGGAVDDVPRRCRR
ncbi:hypothetical protein MTO96_027610 [Rhipicephalus appendiculatus]